MLTDGDVRALEVWVVSARAWAESSQALVGAAIELTASSEALADRLSNGHRALLSLNGDGKVGDVERDRLVADLRALAVEVEEETSKHRERYLQMAASIDQYAQLFA